ncbi:MAG TPA: hypothetical protein VM324_07305 [Egibacteraceae bacterium]|nr:hypothetical protein [Egibacteraceae bacterium]
MRCPACGATNAESADWCSQCYAALVAPTAPDVPEGAVAPPAVDAARQGDGGGHPAPTGKGDGGGHPAAEGFRRRGAIIEWECPACRRWTSVESLQCGACATPLSARWQLADDRPPGLERRFAEPWTAAFALSAVVPGAGHIGLGRYSSGFARAVLFAVWTAGGVVLWRTGGGLAGGPMLAGAGLLWAGSLVDLRALKHRRRELLGGRTLLWLVVAVLALSILGLFTAAAGAPGLQMARVG